jgi:hypothetical protein
MVTYDWKMPTRMRLMNKKKMFVKITNVNRHTESNVNDRRRRVLRLTMLINQNEMRLPIMLPTNTNEPNNPKAWSEPAILRKGCVDAGIEPWSKLIRMFARRKRM